MPQAVARAPLPDPIASIAVRLRFVVVQYILPVS